MCIYDNRMILCQCSPFNAIIHCASQRPTTYPRVWTFTHSQIVSRFSTFHNVKRKPTFHGILRRCTTLNTVSQQQLKTTFIISNDLEKRYFLDIQPSCAEHQFSMNMYLSVKQKHLRANIWFCRGRGGEEKSKNLLLSKLTRWSQFSGR